MRFRLLVTDVDGTLVDHRQEIPKRNLEAAEGFREAGGLVTLATGRIEVSAGPYGLRLGANAPAILYNGGCIHDFTDGRTLWSDLVPPATCRLLIDLLETDYRALVHPILYVSGRPRVREMTETLRIYQQKDRLVLEPVGALYNALALPVSKVLIIGEGTDLQRLDDDLKRTAPPGTVNSVRSEPTYLEVLPVGCNKGTALERLTALLQIPMAEVVAVGDNLNDLEMVRVAGLGVAVANAHPDLKAAARWVSPWTNEEAAVADLIERFCL